MEEEKVLTQVGVYKGLDMVFQMVQKKSVAEAIGKSSVWMANKYNRTFTSGRQHEFYESDMDMLNIAVGRVGNQLRSTRIVYSGDRDDLIEQINTKLQPIVRMPYIYEVRLGKNRGWYNHRMSKVPPSGQVRCFTEDDILQINLAVAEIAARLLSIELVIEK
jgi:hypothetical protein